MQSSNILNGLCARQNERFGDREAIATAPCASAGTLAEALSYRELADRTDRLAYALEGLGIQPGNKIALFTNNCAEALITDFAAYRNRAVPVSIYSTSSPEQVSYIIRDSGARMIFVGEQNHYNTVRSIAGDCPELYKIVAISPMIKIDEDDHMTVRFSSLLEAGAGATEMSRNVVDRRTAEATPEDVATLIYTSGTTGEPKGSVLPHSCFTACMEVHRRALPYLSDKDSSVCFLPLSHIFEKAWSYFCIFMGMHITINRDPREIQETLRVVRPTAMCSVPRFWEKVYAGIQAKIGRVSAFKRWLMGCAVATGRKRNLEYKRYGKRAPWHIELLYKFFYKQIFHPTQKVIGADRGVIFPTAGAPLAPEIVEYLLSLGIPIVIGYGLSETTATVSFYPEHDYEIGTIGKVVEGVNVKISEDGEILVKGPTVMKEYYGRPLDTAQAFTPDGWFRTGDAGYFDPKGSLVLTDRIKDLFKTSNGKYVAPQAIESMLAVDPVFEQIALIGDQRKFVSALIVPERSLVEEYARANNISAPDYASLLEHPEIHSWVEGKIKALTGSLARHEQIKRFRLLPEPFTIENGELTNTLKVKRKVILEHYAEHIARFYEN